MNLIEKIEKLKDEIKKQGKLIKELIEAGESCRKNGIKLEHCWTNDQDYEHHYYMTNKWSHLLGFVTKNSGEIFALGIEGGGCCNYDYLQVWYDNYEEDIYLMVSASENNGIIYVLEKFINNLEEFKISLYEYIESIVAI